jgi:MFS family permease
MVISVLVVSIITYLLPRHEVINSSLTSTRIWPTLGQIKRILAQPKVKFAIFTGLILSLTPDLLIVLLPAIGEGNGWSPAFVGLLLSIRAGAGLLSRTLVRPMLRKLGRIRLLFISLILTSCSLLVFSVSTAHLLVILSLLILGFWNGLAVPVGMQWVGNLTKGPDQSMALGLRLAGNRFGQSVAPLVVSLGVLIGIGLSGFFILLSLTLFFTGMKFRNFNDEETGDISMGRPK